MDFALALGATYASGTGQVTFLLPASDRNEDPIDLKYWEDEALSVMGRIFRGATAFPPGRGVWRDDDRGGELLFDDVILITSYASDIDLESDLCLANLRSFLCRFGRETNQGEVAVVINGRYYGITDYSAGEEAP